MPEEKAGTERGELLWTPSAASVEHSHLTAYMRWLAAEREIETGGDYHALWRWSVEQIEDFWESIWDYFELRASKPYERVLAERTMPGARWFEGAELNVAENLLAGKPAERTAIVHASELRELGELDWSELGDQIASVAAGLRELGVGPGDRVAAYMPNIPETIVAFCATASIGAIWSSCSPDFGPGSVVDRFSQIEPKVLLCVDGYSYGGRHFDRTEVIAGILADLPTVERTVVLPYLDRDRAIGALRDPLTWDELLASGAGAGLDFEQVPFDHPLWVLYSSGTTGLPKAIVHGHGGILLELAKKLHLHVDAHEGDRIFWFTTTGWMMWNFLVGGLLTDATIVLYDGSPGHPDTGVLWDLAADAGITTFGTSASYVAACIKAGVEPASGRDLSRLRAVGSTGSPLAPEGFQWIYDHVGADTWLFSTSGGTDVCTAFVGGVPTLPVYRGELQGRSLGAAIEAWDEEGNPVIDEVGELVITEPMPSMPLFLWGDEDGSRYRASYFEHYPGVWRHGDWIEITSRGTAVIYGRSDSTINRLGVRMGTSEIYRAVQEIDAILDALVIDIPKPGTEGWMPLFVVLREGAELDPELVAEIRRRVRERCSPRHVPDALYRIEAVPRTLSGKALEVPVKRILTGTPPEQAASKDSLANPEALDWFVELAAELERSDSRP
ncbi:MAG TPA: acetoacetate--CoA ligase [Solirubrobacterales bacterium]|nr:acetoacetate--CoA ligase [Solirubrobacterales bacterium]